MKDKKEVILILAGILIIIVMVFVLFGNKKETKESTELNEIKKEEFVQVLNDGTKQNTSNKLAETKKVSGLEISNIQFTNKGGISVLLADVKNNTGKETDLLSILITLIDKSGKTITTIEGIVSPMQNGETVQLNTSVTADYVNAYDFTVKIK